MSTTTATPQAPATIHRPIVGRVETEESVAYFDSDQLVVFGGIGWAGYEEVLKVRGGRARPRLVYLDGDLLLMSPGHSHERDKDRFLLFVAATARALRMRFRSSGSTTYRRRSKDGGVEPDQSFYFANAGRVAGKLEIDLDVDPPPDLAIEVVYSHSADAAVEVSQRLGIPEVWVCDERGLTFLVLGEDGSYEESATSRSFPLLPASEILGWVRHPDGVEFTDLEWLDALDSWMQETLLPRAANHTP